MIVLFILPGRRSPIVRRCRRLRCHKIARDAVYSYIERRDASGCDAKINRLAGNKLSRRRRVPHSLKYRRYSNLPKLTSPEFIRFYSLSRNTWRNGTGERRRYVRPNQKQRNSCLRERIMALLPYFEFPF